MTILRSPLTAPTVGVEDRLREHKLRGDCNIIEPTKRQRIFDIDSSMGGSTILFILRLLRRVVYPERSRKAPHNESKRQDSNATSTFFTTRNRGWHSQNPDRTNGVPFLQNAATARARQRTGYFPLQAVCLFSDGCFCHRLSSGPSIRRLPW